MGVPAPEVYIDAVNSFPLKTPGCYHTTWEDGTTVAYNHHWAECAATTTALPADSYARTRALRLA